MNASVKREVMVAAIALLLAACVLPAGAQQPSAVLQAQELTVAQLPGTAEAQPGQAERAGGEAALVLPPLDLVDVAEGLLEEEDPPAVVREIGPLAEESQPGDVRRQMPVRRVGRVVPRREGRGHAQQERGGQGASGTHGDLR